eukprot:ANDGO_02044.mRNA.1 hypothetical protein
MTERLQDLVASLRAQIEDERASALAAISERDADRERLFDAFRHIYRMSDKAVSFMVSEGAGLADEAVHLMSHARDIALASLPEAEQRAIVLAQKKQMLDMMRSNSAAQFAAVGGHTTDQMDVEDGTALCVPQDTDGEELWESQRELADMRAQNIDVREMERLAAAADARTTSASAGSRKRTLEQQCEADVGDHGGDDDGDERMHGAEDNQSSLSEDFAKEALYEILASKTDHQSISKSAMDYLDSLMHTVCKAVADEVVKSGATDEASVKDVVSRLLPKRIADRATSFADGKTTSAMERL